jgi:hypothetical protein
VVGRNSKQEEVTTFDLASRMVDLEVELSPELTKASRSSASTAAFYLVTCVITTRDALEEFVAVDIWPCPPRWGSWAFKMQWLLGLDENMRSPIFNVKRPADKTDDEVVAEVEKKVVQMIGNFTHKEWECTQRILKHQGRVNRVFDKMGVTYSLGRCLRQPARRCSRQAILDLSLSRPLERLSQARLLQLWTVL